jgi:hypothetical protein
LHSASGKGKIGAVLRLAVWAEKRKNMIGIVDYRAGNLTSVARVLDNLHEPCIITNDSKLTNSQKSQICHSCESRSP